MKKRILRTNPRIMLLNKVYPLNITICIVIRCSLENIIHYGFLRSRKSVKVDAYYYELRTNEVKLII